MLSGLVGRFTAHEALYVDPVGGYNESNARSEFIDPLLAALGWDVRNTAGITPSLREVVREEARHGDDEVNFPDYTLRVGGEARFFVEAKKPSVDVTSHVESIRQARRYGYSAEHPLVVLTNFRDMVIYDAAIAPRPGDLPAVARIGRWHYTEYLTHLDQIRQLVGQRHVADTRWADSLPVLAPARRTPVGEEFIGQYNTWRLRLGEDLRSAEPSVSAEHLNDAVQRILNRLIFVRMCEDRGIEGEQTLREAVGSGSVGGLLNRLHQRYNTGLFDTSEAPLAAKVTETMLGEIVTGLYSPYSPFSFAVLDATFLGLVYEATLAEHLTITAGEVVMRKKREYEHREVVSTPPALVEETVKGVLDARGDVPGTPICLDFAVGSGRFLLTLFDNLAAAETARRVVARTGTLVRMAADDYRLPFADKRRLMEEALFGIDLDYNAVEVAKFSLMVRLLQDETRDTLPENSARSILPDLSDNIVWGNTLVRSLSPGTPAPLIERTQPLDLTATSLPERFDICVGNPPYMKTEDMNRFDFVELDYLKDNYDTAFQQFDKYFCFIEFAAGILQPGGVLGVVVPNKWMTVGAGLKLRFLLHDRLPVVRLDNYRETQLFPGKSTYVCCLIARNQPRGSFAYAEPSQLPPDPRERFEIASDLLPMSATGAWVLPTNTAEQRALRALTRDSIPLGDVLDPRNGIQTSAERDEIYVVTDPVSLPGGLLRWTDKFGQVNVVEEELTRPFLKDSAGLRSFHEVLPDRRIIFPYRPSASSPSGWEVIPPDELDRSFPEAHAYLSRHRDKLDRRKVPAAERLKAFYVYGRTQAIGYAADAPKILYSTNQRGDKYAIDSTGIVYASGGTAGEVALFPRPGSPYDPDFILGLLAQAPVELFLRKRGSVFRGGYYARGTDVIREVPVPRLNFADCDDVSFHDSVVADVRTLRQLNMSTDVVPQRTRTRHAEKIRQSTEKLEGVFNERWRLSIEDVSGLLG